MEYLVTMTTEVPEGTSRNEVDNVRAREATHTRDLADEGTVLRLWRPPLAPGEWRTIGLFTADDPDDLERILRAMPLRVWRTDQVTALGVHANDPGPGTVPIAGDGGEYLVTFAVQPPAGLSREELDDMLAREAERVRELAAEGRFCRLWALAGRGRNLGLLQASGPGRLEETLGSLPMMQEGWLTVETMPLTPHPSDPATIRSVRSGSA